MTIHIILVIYNCKLNLKSSFLSQGNKLFICDNSTDEVVKEFNRHYCLSNSINYLDMQGNKGLSKAYNKAISSIEKKDDNWILILDQDTEITSDFFEKYESAISAHPEKKVFVPVIKDSVSIMSPSHKKGLDYEHAVEINFNNDIENYSFINSGMLINSTIYEKLEYDENLFLDMIDHDFVENVRKTFGNEVFYVIDDLEIFQNFSGVTKNSLKSDLIRFQIFSKDQSYFYKKHYNDTKFSRKKLFLRACKLNLQHKTLKFFKILGETK